MFSSQKMQLLPLMWHSADLFSSDWFQTYTCVSKLFCDGRNWSFKKISVYPEPKHGMTISISNWNSSCGSSETITTGNNSNCTRQKWKIQTKIHT